MVLYNHHLNIVFVSSALFHLAMDYAIKDKPHHLTLGLLMHFVEVCKRLLNLYNSQEQSVIHYLFSYKHIYSNRTERASGCIGVVYLVFCIVYGLQNERL